MILYSSQLDKSVEFKQNNFKRTNVNTFIDIKYEDKNDVRGEHAMSFINSVIFVKDDRVTYMLGVFMSKYLFFDCVTLYFGGILLCNISLLTLSY